MPTPACERCYYARRPKDPGPEPEFTGMARTGLAYRIFGPTEEQELFDYLLGQWTIDDLMHRGSVNCHRDPETITKLKESFCSHFKLRMGPVQ